MTEKNYFNTEIKKISSLLNPSKEKEIKTESHFWQYCVNCGNELISKKCKLICPNCGFYHSCSEP